MFNHSGEKPTRSFLSIDGPLCRVNITAADPVNSKTYESSWKLVEGVMDSFSNPLPPQNYPNSGGPWYQKKIEDNRTTVELDDLRISGQRRVKGFVFLDEPAFTLSPASYSLDSDQVLFGLGATAISRSLPNAPSFDLATFLGEAKSGMPSMIGASIWRSKALTARDAGKEYLNADFGWAPLLRDIQDFASVVAQSSEILDDYVKNQRKNMRVHYEFPSEQTIVNGEGLFGLKPNNLSAASARGTAQVHYSKRTWFDGCYWYHIPNGKDASGNLQHFASMARKLLGTSVTPEVLWNVSPWSWCADWFGNIGDVLRNVSHLGQDSLALRYGYLMQEVKILYRYNAVVTAGDSKSPASREKAVVYRRRLPSTPYGFGVAFDGFSPGQLATMAALGLSKS